MDVERGEAVCVIGFCLPLERMAVYLVLDFAGQEEQWIRLFVLPG